jgi:predicted nucleotidyltransferase
MNSVASPLDVVLIGHPCYICKGRLLNLTMVRSEKTRVIEDLLRENRDEILRIAEKHGARNVRIFGSVAHGEATEASDLDLLVDTAEQTSPWFPAGLAAELEALLGQRVDVVTSNGLYWLLRRRILKEARPL